MSSGELRDKTEISQIFNWQGGFGTSTLLNYTGSIYLLNYSVAK